MKRLILLLSIVLSFECHAQKIKVACVGNSITYGAFILNREHNSYPAQLQEYLGEEYEVKNFGISGTTALKDGLYSYRNTSAYKESLEWNPDIVLIKLGTNDASERNDRWRQDFEKDYTSLVASYASLPSSPRIILLTPVRCFLPTKQDREITSKIIPVIHKTAFENGYEIINLHNMFGDRWQHYLFPDKLHPSSIGMGRIAAKIHSYLSLEQSHDGDVVSKFALKPCGEFNFHGYKGYKFDNNGVKYYIVKPNHVAEGKPWIWRARFWGHEPQLDIDLLERGFHLTYCEVGDLYGSQTAVDRWNTFYKLATRAGLNKKVALEGMSRGGLIIYNWAAQNVKKVACIYGDAPVMDFKSWPMGEGKYRGDDHCVKTMLAAYGFSSREEALAWQHNPIDHARVFAKAKTPILHVVGDADVVVPVDENSAIFETRLKEYGHSMKIIHKANVGHHPHSLNNPEPILKFILKATGQWKNECIHPVPGNEFRAGAGWTKDSDWHAEAEDIKATLQGRKIKLLMLGNSITQALGGDRLRVVNKSGKEAMDAAMGEKMWENAGISGDRTQHLLWRLREGNYNVAKPDVAVITIGINNLNAGDSAADVAEGILACAKEARYQLPDSKIILLGVLPAGRAVDSSLRKACEAVHEILSKSRIRGVEYVNPTSWFVCEDGSLREGLYAGDCLHLSAEGYKVWSQKLAQLID
ncbi:MAG: prolyl oligopeptidase family serine peptidase [Alistipes sp.]|nr:prolyl oligopeptidase family serine peptidase [Alistipes sp.]